MHQRLLLIDPSYARGGAEEYLLTIGRAAARAGWAVTAGLAAGPAVDALRRDLNREGIRTRRVLFTPSEAGTPLMRFVSTCLEFLSVLLLASPRRADATLVVLPWPDRAFGTVMALAVRRVGTVIVFQLMPFPVNLSRIRRGLYRWAGGRRQRWVAVSEDNRKAGVKSFGVPPTAFTRIYNGYDLSGDAPDVRAARESVRAEFQMAPDDTLLLSVGRLAEQKGHADVIPAISELASEWPSLRYAIAGSGPLRDALGLRAEACGVADRVLLLGNRADIGRLLRAADVFVFPSHFEGAPFALLEAMAAGTPIVASDAGVMSELLTPDKHAILFRCGDSASALAALRRCLTDPASRRERSEAALRRVSEFSEQRMTATTLDLVLSLSSAR